MFEFDFLFIYLKRYKTWKVFGLLDVRTIILNAFSLF